MPGKGFEQKCHLNAVDLYILFLDNIKVQILELSTLEVSNVAQYPDACFTASNKTKSLSRALPRGVVQIPPGNL